MRGVPNKHGRGRPKAVRYRKLRERMGALQISAENIADRLHKDGTSIGRRLSGATPWQIDEAYAVMEMLDIPAEEFHIYFPKYGTDAPETTTAYLEHYLSETGQVLVDETAFNSVCDILERIRERMSRGVTA